MSFHSRTPSRCSHGDERNRKLQSLEALVREREDFSSSHDSAQYTPRSLRRSGYLSLADINKKIDADWIAALTTPRPAQADMLPRYFDHDHDHDHAGNDAGNLSETARVINRRHTEPQYPSPQTRRPYQKSCASRFTPTGPPATQLACGDWSYRQGCTSSDNYEVLSPRNSYSEESEVVAAKLNDTAEEGVLRWEQLNRKVLLAMETQTMDRRRSSVDTAISNQRRDSEQIRSVVGHEPPARSSLAAEYVPPLADPVKPPYQPLSRPESQIRLFRLAKTGHDDKVRGSFLYTDIKSSPRYTALSYAWGEPTKTRKISIEGQDDFEMGENLWWFLHCRSLTMKKPRLFWIDAICIDQSNVNERNHQVGLMKQIYSMASSVYIWLGRESANSRLAMDFLASEGAKPHRRQAGDHRPIWDRQGGKAVRDLCERPYWRRMWIIQEIIHANRLTVWCGPQRVDWPVLDRLYLTMRTLEGGDRLGSHDFVKDVLRSPAFVMVWQRAHWRHPETPTPKLQTLIEVFQGWGCTDLRDKVYALVSMADHETAVTPNYSRSPQQIYHDVLRRGVACDDRFRRLLAQVLGLRADGHGLKL